MKIKSKRRKGLKAKKYNLGGYLDPNGDPTKKPGQAVAESTAVPNYAEQAFLNYAGLMPQLQPPLFRDEGTIRQAPENDPSFLQSLWAGTPLGQTEYERYALPDQMSMVDVMAEPLKALSYYSIESNRGKLPTRAEWDAFDDSNAIDMATSIVNPFWYMSEMSKGGSEGLAGITGVGKIGQVVRDAFNTGDDLLRITAENVSKQGQKMTQRQLAQQINKSPLVDLEEAVYNPEIYGVEAPGFGVLARNKNAHYLGQPGGPLASQLQKQHAEEYGINVEGFGNRYKDYFNVTDEGYELPITRSLDVSESDDGLSAFYEPGQFISGSVPQIKPLQAGGELEKFVKKDGTININEVAEFVGTSKSISPADKFILNEAIAKMSAGGVEFMEYNGFKRDVSQYIPRMSIRSESEHAPLGVSKIFPGLTDDKYTSDVAVISETNLPHPVYSDAGVEMENYMLDNSVNDKGMHYGPVLDKNGSNIGSHSHYRVVRKEDEPEVSYFLEIQSDALQPGGLSDYNRMIDSGREAMRSVNMPQFEANIGNWSLDDFTGETYTRSKTPLGLIKSLTTDYQGVADFNYRMSEIIEENKNLFPPFSKEEIDRFDAQTQKKAENAINALSRENFNKIFKNSIEPRLIDQHSKYVLQRDIYDGRSGIQLGIDNAINDMKSIENMLEPGGDFIREALKSDEAYENAVSKLRSLYKYTSRRLGQSVEMLDDVDKYLSYKFQDFHEFNSQLKTFLSEYESKFVDNPFLNDLMISLNDVRKIQAIRNEIQEIQSVVSRNTQALADTKHDVTKIMGAFNVYDEQVFPLEDTYLALTGPFKKTQENLESAKFWASSLIDGAGSMHYEGFEETIKNLPDLNPLADRYNELISEFDKEAKKFADKYLPVVPGGKENPVSHIMKKRPERRIIAEALHGPHNNLYNRFPTEETSRKIQGHPAIGEPRAQNYDAVQRKYKNMEKTLRAMGYEPKRVLDIYGNSWWEVKGSAGMIHGTAEYDAYWKGGRIGLKKKRSGKMRPVKC